MEAEGKAGITLRASCKKRVEEVDPDFGPTMWRELGVAIRKYHALIK